MPYDPAAAVILDILEKDKERVASANVLEMDRVRRRMEAIQANPNRKDPLSYNQATLTGSLLEALGIRKRAKGRPSEVEINMQEINEREEKEWAEKRAKKQASTASTVGVKIGVKKNTQKRSRTRREH